ncbi:unnamed protein product [Heligmosomoides polygyrus]|uniref:Uncharacterized protein n=1 Tax=Heligmosomoides polygyrus TaxID=6339 RepID=A0A183GPY8_HELPZ|nr:unnamed protein product [Heligmosomoides polygyrus]
METKMLRWTAGVTRTDRIRNDVIRQKLGVAPIAERMREARLRRCSRVLRGKEDSVRKISLELEVSGKRPRRRPKQRLSDRLHMDMKVTGVNPDQAQDREGWRHDTRRADPATKRENAEEEEEEKDSAQAIPSNRSHGVRVFCEGQSLNFCPSFSITFAEYECVFYVACQDICYPDDIHHAAYFRVPNCVHASTALLSKEDCLLTKVWPSASSQRNPSLDDKQNLTESIMNQYRSMKRQMSISAKY